jgi:ribosome biogenesis protein ENP2
LLLGAGSKGQVDIFDFRFDRKLYKIKSSYNEPINSIHFTEDIHKSVLISNKKQIKITQNEGEFFTSVEPDVSINMFTIVKGTGMILAALEDPKIGCYFIPQFGSAPKWVPYIENITEELEEEQRKMVYDEYKFVTKQEIFELGCTNLIGTKMLKEYMHGYLMHLKLYNKFQDKLQMINYA